MTAEYLTVPELSQRIKYTEQSVYNLIFTGTFIEGRHFFKPTPKKILFKWQSIVDWIEGKEPGAKKDKAIANPYGISSAKPTCNIRASAINI